MFDSMRIRTKLAFALAIPLIALIAMSLLVVNEASTDAEAAALLPVVRNASAETRRQAWTEVAHALFASVEFRYVH